MSDPLVIAGREFRSRLITGTGKYPSLEVMRDAVVASGCELVTVAVRRIDLDEVGEAITDWLPEGVRTAAEHGRLPDGGGGGARRAARARRRSARTGSSSRSSPTRATCCRTARRPCGQRAQLVDEGFTVLPYVMPDPVLQRKLEAAGCATVMPLAAPIGSGRGLKLRHTIEIMIEQAEVPVIVDAGLGAPSQAAECMEIGADGVLVNTAIGLAGDPVAMARAFALGVEAGPGRAPRRADRRVAGGAAVQPDHRASSPREDPLQRQGARARAGRDGVAPARRARRSTDPTRSSSGTASRSSGSATTASALEEGDRIVVARPVAGG